MKHAYKTLAFAGLAFAICSTAISANAAQKLPLNSAEPIKIEVTNQFAHQWHPGHIGIYIAPRPVYRPRHHHRPHYRGHYQPHGINVGAFLGGAVIGGIISQGIHHRSGHVGWCKRHYKSYRVHSNSFQPFHGPRKRCRSPYSR